MELTVLRDRIDHVDEEILRQLEKRMDISVRIARILAQQQQPPRDSERERATMQHMGSLCREKTAEEILPIFEAILAGTRHYQEKELQAEKA